jgi:hypothetical protein
VLASKGDEREGSEDHHDHQQLGEFDGAGNRSVEEFSPANVEKREGHDREQGRAAEQAAQELEPLGSR